MVRSHPFLKSIVHVQFQKNNFQQGLEDLEKANLYMLNNYDVLCTLGSVQKQQTEQLIWIQIKQVRMH